MGKLLNIVDYIVIIAACMVIPTLFASDAVKAAASLVELAIGQRIVDLPFAQRVLALLPVIPIVGGMVGAMVMLLMAYFAIRRGESPLPEIGLRPVLRGALYFTSSIFAYMLFVFVIGPSLRLAFMVYLLIAFSVAVICTAVAFAKQFIPTRSPKSP